MMKYLKQALIIVVTFCCTYVMLFYWWRIAVCEIKIKPFSINLKTVHEGSYEQSEGFVKSLDNLNSKDTAQNDVNVIKIIQQHFFKGPSNKPYNLLNPELHDFSRGQSKIVDDLLNHKRNGFYVECGALDGEGRSNSLFFEREREWQGLLIEADPSNYKQLLNRNRKAHTINACLSILPYPAKLKFNPAINMGRIMKGKAEIEWAKQHHLKIQPIDIQCFPLYTLVLSLNHTKIDFFSLDVEGSEMEVLETIPFDTLDITTITVEFAHGGSNAKQKLQGFLESKGYTYIATVTRPDGSANDIIMAKTSYLKAIGYHKE